MKIKLSFLATVLGFMLCVDGDAKIGETSLELLARYGEPTNPFGLLLGMFEWNTQQGSVYALIKNGTANLIQYRGAVSSGLTNELLERNLATGQKWVESSRAREWAVSKNVQPLPSHVSLK